MIRSTFRRTSLLGIQLYHRSVHTAVAIKSNTTACDAPRLPMAGPLVHHHCANLTKVAGRMIQANTFRNFHDGFKNSDAGDKPNPSGDKELPYTHDYHCKPVNWPEVVRIEVKLDRLALDLCSINTSLIYITSILGFFATAVLVTIVTLMFNYPLQLTEKYKKAQGETGKK